MFGKNRHNDRSEFSDPVTVETRSALQGQINKINDLLEVANERIARSFAQKTRGLKHDGEHNIDVDGMSMYIQQLETRKQELLARIERINKGLASTAIRSSTDS